MLASVASTMWFISGWILLQINYFGNNVPSTPPKNAEKATTTVVAKAAVAKTKKQAELPKVFVIADDQAAFEQLSGQYPTALLEVCAYDMDAAYNKWTNMMHAFELHADKNNVNIKGVKMWVKVYWAADGSVDHLGYSLKPNSRNVKADELNALFRTFIEKYKLPQTNDIKFSHYGSVSFPLFLKTQ
jgi:hypothetical protein